MCAYIIFPLLSVIILTLICCLHIPDRSSESSESDPIQSQLYLYNLEQKRNKRKSFDFNFKQKKTPKTRVDFSSPNVIYIIVINVIVEYILRENSYKSHKTTRKHEEHQQIITLTLYL